MPTITAKVECPVYPSFRVTQIEGLFGLKPAKATGHTFTVEVPDTSEPWKVGAIVGPSGSGKSTVAQQAFGDCLYRGGDWPDDKAMIDGFPEKVHRPGVAEPQSLNTKKEIIETLTAVGFGTALDWRKPYRVLSNGQRFRADLARALLTKPFVAIDEMTSLLDRKTAFACCVAAAKAVRSGQLGDLRFVAISCHYDIIEPLACDWVLDMATQTLSREGVRRRERHLQVVPVSRAAWPLFEPFHYLDSRLHQSSQCFCAVWDGEPVAFCAMLHAFGFKGYMRVHRVVTLPDFQGAGVGSRLMECCAQIYKDEGQKVNIIAAHPAVLRHCARSPLWKLSSVKKLGNKRHGNAPEHKANPVVSAGRPIVSFEYVGHR